MLVEPEYPKDENSLGIENSSAHLFIRGRNIAVDK